MIEIVPAQSESAIEHVIALSQEYTTWMVSEIRVRYPDLDLHQFMGERDYDDLRKKFPGEHVPPHGGLLIAMHDDKVCGCVALGRLTETIGEIRTLYVRPASRGSGAGKRLVEAIISVAHQAGYRYVRLDTLAFMTGAQTLYRSLGFYDIDAYHEVAPLMTPYLCFFEQPLTESLD